MIISFLFLTISYQILISVGLLSMLGSKAISELQDKFAAKCYFNTLIPFEDGLIKYGVINRNNLIADLLDWESLYIAGRLHKPVRIIHEISKNLDAELHMALRMNLKNALHTSLLLLPEKFTEQMLYETLAGLSYQGDFRMTIGEDKNKVKKISTGSFNELQELYANQLSKMSEFVYMPTLQGWSNRGFQSVVFNSGPKMALRAFYFINVNKTCGSQRHLLATIENLNQNTARP